jgi:hypothetical protein
MLNLQTELTQDDLKNELNITKYDLSNIKQTRFSFQKFTYKISLYYF